MAKRDYGILSTEFFTNRKINGLSLPAQLLYIYISQGPHSNGIGLYRLPIDYIISDLRSPMGKLKKKLKKSTVDDRTLISHWLKELIDLGLIAYCVNTEYVCVRDFLDWNPISNRNVWVGRVKELRQAPKNVALDVEIKEILEKLSKRQADFGHKISTQDKDLINKQLQRFGNGSEMVAKPLRKGLQVPIPIPIPIPIPEPYRAEQSANQTKLADSGLIVPLEGRRSFTVPSELLNEWIKTYPAIDCRTEIKRLITWNKSNPEKQKTSRGIKRHINAWLSKASDTKIERSNTQVGKVAKQFKSTGYGETGVI